ncbi:MAG: hypothetical protein U0802_06300 [Candidatus Binatia bacterium]
MLRGTAALLAELGARRGDPVLGALRRLAAGAAGRAGERGAAWRVKMYVRLEDWAPRPSARRCSTRSRRTRPA